jgi:glutamate N-acetyltransferase/amino-acid N-acetyltransferase
MMDFEIVSGGITAAKGFLAAGVAAGVKYKDKKDIALIYSQTDAVVAGVYTTNRVKAASLLLTMERAAGGKARAVVVNSGNANSCNGNSGMESARSMTERAASALGIPAETVLVASTGVIGQAMPMERIIPGIDAAVIALAREGGKDAAESIMTTDTTLKQYAASFEAGGKIITIGGMAKGSGMIHPNMATMLCFITTDAAIERQCLEECLRQAADVSFNMVTVDGDTSTNDMVLALANGEAGNDIITGDSADRRMFGQALTNLCTELAKMVAADGEGATKLIEVKVQHAATEKDARLAARAVAASSLFKAAVFGRDANWGRIICAAGYSGAEFDPERVDIFIGDEKVAGNGAAMEFSEDRAAELLSRDTVSVTIDLKDGDHRATAWGCDLTYEYVRINGDYRS